MKEFFDVLSLSVDRVGQVGCCAVDSIRSMKASVVPLCCPSRPPPLQFATRPGFICRTWLVTAAAMSGGSLHSTI